MSQCSSSRHSAELKINPLGWSNTTSERERHEKDNNAQQWRKKKAKEQRKQAMETRKQGKSTFKMEK